MNSMIRPLLALLAICATTTALAQYPNRPIRFVMAYPPAGSSDVLARPIANEMTKGLGQPVLLEYKPGAGSTIGADFTAKSAPDQPSCFLRYRISGPPSGVGLRTSARPIARWSDSMRGIETSHAPH